MEKRLEQLEIKLDSFGRKLDKVGFYLESDSLTNRKGAIEELSEVKRLLSELLTREKIYKARAITAGGIGATIVMLAWKAGAYLLTVIK